MINIVYVDVYFCFNFLMDFFVLYIVRLLLKEGGWSGKDCIAALVGATYATVILVVGKGGFLEGLFTYLLIPVAISIITSRQRTISVIFKRIGIIYFCVFVISGMINAIYYGSLIGKTLFEKTLEIELGNISIWLIITVMVICISIIKTIWNVAKSHFENCKNLYEVSVIVGEQKIKAIGLRDTGNQLIEPLTGKSVFIIEKNLLQKVDYSTLKPIYIPFNSVGKEHGLMEGFVGDLIIIEGNLIEKPIIGIHKGKLSRENKYNMILPPNICKGESK